MAWNNMYRPDYEYAKIVGTTNLIEPVAKYINILKDEHVANARYKQEWEAKQEAARQKKLLDDSVIADNNSKVKDRDSLTPVKVNDYKASAYQKTTAGDKNKVEIPKIQADTKLIGEKTTTEIETRQPIIDLKEAQTGQANAYAGKAIEETKQVAPLAKATITHKDRTGRAALGQAGAAQTSAGAAVTNAKTNQEKAAETARYNKEVEVMRKREADIKALSGLMAPTLEEKKELKQTAPGKANGGFQTFLKDN